MIVKVEDQTFEDLTGHTLSNVSYLKLFNILYDTDEEIYFMNIFRSYIINPSLTNNIFNYLSYSVNDDAWWEQISNIFYKNTSLWWAVCLTNKVINPFEELEPGENLKIIKEGFLPQLLKEIQEVSTS